MVQWPRVVVQPLGSVFETLNSHKKLSMAMGTYSPDVAGDRDWILLADDLTIGSVRDLVSKP